jgi:hypothetical protein
MPEFEHVGGGERKSSPKFKLNKKNIVLYGGVLLVVLFVVTKVLGRKPQSAETQTIMTDDGMPSNSVDTQAQLDNFSSIMEGYVEQSMNQLYSEVGMSIGQALNDQKQYNTEMVNSLTQQYNELKNEQEKLNVSLENKQPSTNTPSTSTPSSGGSFQSGSFSSMKDAQMLLAKLTKSYGGQGGKIVNQNGKYIVQSNFTDQQRAQKVGEDLKSKGSIGVYHAKGGE